MHSSFKSSVGLKISKTKSCFFFKSHTHIYFQNLGLMLHFSIFNFSDGLFISKDAKLHQTVAYF